MRWAQTLWGDNLQEISHLWLKILSLLGAGMGKIENFTLSAVFNLMEQYKKYCLSIISANSRNLKIAFLKMFI
jgi:hypothetical protein